MPVRGLLAIAVTTVVAVLAAPAAAENRTVLFPGRGAPHYTPSSVRIAPGDSITWSSDSPITATFANHPLRSARASEPYSADAGLSFAHPFASAGIYRYYCAIHGVSFGDNEVAGMSGTVVVTANTPPNATFTVTPGSIHSGEEVTVDAGGSSDAAGPVTYAWDFDGDSVYDDGAGPVVRHVLATPAGASASLPIQLKVTDANADAVGPESSFAVRFVTVLATPAQAPPPAHLPGSGTGGAGTGTLAPKRPRIEGRRLRVRSGKVRLRIVAPRAMTGKVTLEGAGRLLARGRAALTPQRQTVRLRLTKAGRRLITRRRSRAARVVARLRDEAGAVFRVTARVRVRR